MCNQQYVPCVYENFPQHIKDELTRKPSGIVRGCWECHQLFVSTPHKPHFCSKECEDLFNKKQFYYYGILPPSCKRKRKRSEPLIVAFESDKEKYRYYDTHPIDVGALYAPVIFVNNDLRTPEDEVIIKRITKGPLRDDEFLIRIGPTQYDVRVVRSREQKIEWDMMYQYEPYGFLRLFNDDGVFIDVICSPYEEFEKTLKRCLWCGKIHSNFWRREYVGGYSFCCDHCLNIFKKVAREDQNRALQILNEHEDYNHI